MDWLTSSLSHINAMTAIDAENPAYDSTVIEKRRNTIIALVEARLNGTSEEEVWKRRDTCARRIYHEKWKKEPLFAIEFPPILSGDTLQRVQAIISAATLDGKTPSSIDLPTVTRMLLIALGEDDVDEIINRLYPDGQVPDQQPAVDGNRPQSEALMVEAVRELRDSLVKLQ